MLRLLRMDPRSNVDAMVVEVTGVWEPPNILVNNAGANVFNEPLSSTSEDWRRCMAVDLEGAWHCARAVLPKMIEARSGAIVSLAPCQRAATTPL